MFVWLYPGEPARAVNLASAVFGALAVGLAAWLAARLAESTVAGLAAGMFLAFSYTFWSQAITAEVYTLHLLLVGAALVALLAWAEQPAVGRLALFYAIYALGFGNHLSMVLLLPALAVFLLIHRRPGPADPLRPQMIVIAILIAMAGGLQYAWNFRGLWTELEPPASLGEAIGKFWFDVTKADWRETLVMSVSETGLKTRPAMYWFDLRQQFGVPGVMLAAAGFMYLAVRWPGRGVLLLLLYASNLAFAWTYNVGDAYIFFLPSHYIVALCAGAGVAAVIAVSSRLLSNRTLAISAGVLLLVYPAWRGYDTFPAVDRSWDNRAVKLLEQFTARPDNVVFGVDSNWQVQNAFEYFMREHRPGIPWFATEELTWLEWPGGRDRFEAFIKANANAERDIIVTPRVYEKIRNPPTSPWQHDLGPAMQFSAEVKSVRQGTPYVFAVLSADREYPLNTTEIARVWQWLTTEPVLPNLHQYTVFAGTVGERPVLIESRDRPYRVRVRIDALDVDIRMESWLPTDTIRRTGFGHVIVNGRHELTLERGVSFKALGTAGEPIYDSGLFAPIPRILVRPNPQPPIPNP
jgi:4-amino-4-deoxy-L-arabinose transferase-like glycosyltransferase